jgi:bifunctional non-homologous end joining protein LigD
VTARSFSIDGAEVRLSNLDRVLFPESGFTKGDLVGFYLAAAPALLPHLQARPLTMRRFPDGVGKPGFWEKNCPSHRPEWVETVSIWSDSHQAAMEYCVVGDRAALAWVANLAGIELHTPLARAAHRDRPTAVVFDLDPGPSTGMVECAALGLLIREMLERIGLACVAKTSGSKGLQLYVPLNTGSSYEQTKPFARAVAAELERQLPDRVVSNMAKSKRPGKVLVDWSQNSEHKTTVCAYSVRARAQPSVSTPVSWDEVGEAARGSCEDPLRFSPQQVLDRIERHGDLFSPMGELRQELPSDWS